LRGERLYRANYIENIKKGIHRPISARDTEMPVITVTGEISVEAAGIGGKNT
jgi:hypothetical protein